MEAILLGTDSVAKYIAIGMWLDAIMWFNVWFVIWPNQKRGLGSVDAVGDVKAASARWAALFSRVKIVMLIPMVYAMVSAIIAQVAPENHLSQAALSLGALEQKIGAHDV